MDAARGGSTEKKEAAIESLSQKEQQAATMQQKTLSEAVDSMQKAAKEEQKIGRAHLLPYRNIISVYCKSIYHKYRQSIRILYENAIALSICQRFENKTAFFTKPFQKQNAKHSKYNI